MVASIPVPEHISLVRTLCRSSGYARFSETKSTRGCTRTDAAFPVPGSRLIYGLEIYNESEQSAIAEAQ